MNRFLRGTLFLAIAGLAAGAAHAAREDVFFEPLPASEQLIGIGRSALWTLPNVATEYRPAKPTPAVQAAMQAQAEGRFLEALMLLEEAGKGARDGDAAEAALLRASFLLQGNQAQQAAETLAPLLADARHGADAHALMAMARLQQGQTQQALEAAQRAKDLRGGLLAHLVLSYALQGGQRLAEARDAIHDFNSRAPQQAVALAREAELALMLDDTATALALAGRAREADAEHPYVASVYGLASLIGGQAGEAKFAFETALKRDPRDAKALFGLGLADIRLGNLEAGRDKLGAANESAAGDALILTYLGRAQQQLGQTEAARESWRQAQDADPKDPIPWLYEGQAQLADNRPQQAQESLREAQARIAHRSVYRSERLLAEDGQLLRANLAEAQRRLGQEELAFRTLADPIGGKNSATLRNQADLLQGRRFGESARRSLLLQSLFDERPGNLPAELDIYGDGSWETGASVPQHGVVGELGAQRASLNTYDELFARRATLAADAVAAGFNTGGGQVRFGYGGDTLGVGLAHRQFRAGGNARFENLDNRLAQAIVQWRPFQSTQAFASWQTFDSQHEETMFPGDPGFAAQPIAVGDHSQVVRLGLRHGLAENSELRALLSRQQTDQMFDYLDPATGISFYGYPSSSRAHGAELQYRDSGAGHAAQWGVQQQRGQIVIPDYGSDYTKTTRQFYAARQQALGSHWQLDAQLAWGQMENLDNTGGGNGTYLRRWLPGLGLIYAPDDVTHLRLAAWRGMAMSHLGDAALAPPSLAGILLRRPGDNNPNGNLSHGVALGADKRLSSAWLLEGRAQRRRLDSPMSPLAAQTFRPWQIDDSRLALHWQGQPWAASLACEQERYQAPPFRSFMTLDSVQEQRLRALRLDMRWFAGEKWTARLALSHNRVDGQLQTTWGTALSPYRDNFGQVDAGLDWQIARAVSLTAGVRNATNRSFRYTDTDPLNPRFSDGRMGYARLGLTW